MKSKDLQLRLLYPARLSFKMESEIKRFSDKRRLKEYTSTKPALQEMLRDCFEKKEREGEREREREGERQSDTKEKMELISTYQ